jgi:hypothetical protein
MKKMIGLLDSASSLMLSSGSLSLTPPSHTRSPALYGAGSSLRAVSNAVS